MRVLIACEFSGIVRDAFAALGHDATSCDLLPSERQTGERRSHIIYDAISVAKNSPWDLIIAHPPCTLLTVAGARWWAGREREQQEAVEFATAFEQFAPKCCTENPIGRLSTVWRKPEQIIQPWQFGHGETKATCLWLKNLPLLKPTNIVAGRVPRVHFASPGPDRWKERSRTLQGIADAMAAQWGGSVN